ncbi:MAG TPA: hypothetical protein GX717_03485, partial [Clostridiaceae bacterium]|nr:hypothetical protein [Clostridiaceae bacterium]
MLLYYLAKLPGLGALFAKSKLARKDSKIILVVPGILFRFIRLMLSKNALLWLTLSAIPNLFMSAGISEMMGPTDKLFQFLLLFGLLPAVSGNSLLGNSRENAIFLGYFRIDPAVYYRTSISRSIFLDLALLFPALPLLITSLNLWSLAIVGKLTFLLAGHTLFLYVLRKKGRFPKKSARYIAMGIVFAVYFAFLLLWRIPSIEHTKWPYLLNAVLIAVSIFAFQSVWNSDLFVVIAQLRHRDERTGVTMSAVNSLQGGSEKLEQFTAVANRTYYEKHSSKKPIDYLHQTFFT